jgi:flagellar capping protein FliD
MNEHNGSEPNRLDRIERALDFLVEQQGQFLTGIQRLEALHEQTKAAHEQTEAALRRAIRLGMLEMRRERVRRHELEEKVDILIDAQIGYEERADRRAQRLEAKLERLVEAQAGYEEQAEKRAQAYEEQAEKRAQAYEEQAEKRAQALDAKLDRLADLQLQAAADTALLKQALTEMVRPKAQLKRQTKKVVTKAGKPVKR